MSWYSEQLSNRNYLSPIGFKFLIDKAKKVSFLCQKASIPTFSISNLRVNTPGFVTLPVADGQPTFGDLLIEFVVDEDLRNYMQIHNWMRAMSTPDNYDERFDWIDTEGSANKNNRIERDRAFISDCNLMVLNNNNLTNFEVKFRDVFPIELSSLPFDVTRSDNDFFTATATFKYTYYEIVNTNTSVRR